MKGVYFWIISIVAGFIWAVSSILLTPLVASFFEFNAFIFPLIILGISVLLFIVFSMIYAFTKREKRTLFYPKFLIPFIVCAVIALSLALIKYGDRYYVKGYTSVYETGEHIIYNKFGIEVLRNPYSCHMTRYNETGDIFFIAYYQTDYEKKPYRRYYKIYNKRGELQDRFSLITSDYAELYDIEIATDTKIIYSFRSF